MGRLNHSTTDYLTHTFCIVEKKYNVQTREKRIGEWPRCQVITSFREDNLIWDQPFSSESKPGEKGIQLVNFEKMGTWKSWGIKIKKDFISLFMLARCLSYVSSTLIFTLHQSQTIWRDFTQSWWTGFCLSVDYMNKNTSIQ